MNSVVYHMVQTLAASYWFAPGVSLELFVLIDKDQTHFPTAAELIPLPNLSCPLAHWDHPQAACSACPELLIKEPGNRKDFSPRRKVTGEPEARSLTCRMSQFAFLSWACICQRTTWVTRKSQQSSGCPPRKGPRVQRCI